MNAYSIFNSNRMFEDELLHFPNEVGTSFYTLGIQTVIYDSMFASIVLLK